MDSSWLSETSSEIANYLYEHISPSGDEQTAGTQALSSLRALSKGFWITDLPTNDYEPLENSPVAKEVSVFFFLLSLRCSICCIVSRAPNNCSSVTGRTKKVIKTTYSIYLSGIQTNDRQ